LTQLKPDCANQSCPVCRRDFADVDEMNETINELRKYTSKLPQKITDLENKIKVAQDKLNDMVNAKSIKEAYDRLKNGELVSLKTQIDQYDKDMLPKLRAELKESDAELKEIEKRKQFAEQLQNEIVIIDKYASECNDIERKIDMVNRNNPQLSGSDDANLDLDELNMEKSAIQTEMSRLAKLIESKRDEMTRNYARTDQINSMKEKLNEMKTRRNELAMKSQKKTQMIDKKCELESEINEAEQSITQLNSELKASVANLNRLISERQAKQSENQATLAKRSKYFDEIKDMHNRVKDQIEYVMNFESSDDPTQAKQLKKELREIDLKEREINSEIEKLRGKLDDIRTELARQDIKHRELNDNLKLREKRAEYTAKNKQYAEIKERLQLSDSSIDVKNFKNEQRRAELKRDELNKELSETKNAMLTLEGRLQAIREELALDTHKDALQKFLQCSSDLKVIELSVLDMDKYYKALDKAIMSYHSIKMSEINKSIKQLWRSVYRGNDIDYIEIRSEEESPGEEKEQQIKTRRSYNYRVVLIKGETCLDMRGRCSAGQKVLASIIIRLALAETFCLNSGILALDEPTTNLDRENIESLASALVE
jgi:DNA repair protein RAD50